MPFLPPILARSGEDQWIKLVFGAVVFFFWLIGAIVSAINKKTQENKRRDSLGQLPQNLGAARFPIPARPPVKTRTASRPAAPARQPVPPRQSYAAPAAPAIEAMPVINLSRASAATQVTQKKTTAAPVAPANQIGRLLRRSDSLRAAFILNEVMSPPLSLRDAAGQRHA
jgi:hypothetical protein